MFPETGFFFASPDPLLFSDFNSLAEFDDLIHKDIFLSTDVALVEEMQSKEAAAHLAIPQHDDHDGDDEGFHCSMMKQCQTTIPPADIGVVDHEEEDDGALHNYSSLTPDTIPPEAADALPHAHLNIRSISEVDDEFDCCSPKQLGDCCDDGESPGNANEHLFNIALFADDAAAAAAAACSMSMVEDMASSPVTMPAASTVLLIPSPEMEASAAAACEFVGMDTTMVFRVTPTELSLSPRTLATTSKMNSMSLLDHEIDTNQKAAAASASIPVEAAQPGIKALESVPHLPPLSPYRRTSSISPILSCTVDAAAAANPPSLFTLPPQAVTTAATETLIKPECTTFMNVMLGDMDACKATSMTMLGEHIDVPKANAMLSNADKISGSRFHGSSAQLKLQDMEFPRLYDLSRIQTPNNTQESFMRFPSASPHSSAIQRSHSSHDLGQLRASINHALCHDNEPPSELDTFLSRNSDAVTSQLHRHQTWNPQQFIVRPASSSMRRVYSTGDLQVLANYGGNMESSRSEESAAAGSSRIGHCTVEERKMKLHRYRQKRHERNFTKKIKYACRKTLADSRPRIRGRFARTDESEEPQFVESFSSSRNNRHLHPQRSEASCIMSRTCTMANTAPRFWTAVGMNVAM